MVPAWWRFTDADGNVGGCTGGCVAAQVQVLDDNKVLGGSGPQADRVRFLEYIEKNVKLTALRTGLTASCHGTAHYVRREVCTAHCGTATES